MEISQGHRILVLHSAKDTQTRFSCFFKYLLPYVIPWPCILLSDANVARTCKFLQTSLQVLRSRSTPSKFELSNTHTYSMVIWFSYIFALRKENRIQTDIQI